MIASNSQPLLQQVDEVERQESTQAESIPSSKSTACKSRSIRVMAGIGLLVVGACLLLFAFVATTGGFNHVKRDVRIVNGSVVEPNTKLVFPLNRPVTLKGDRGPERLLGVFLKIYQVPALHENIKVVVMAMYVDRAEARRILLPYKSSGHPHQFQDPTEFAQFVQLLSSGQITITMQYHYMITTQSNKMQTYWLDALTSLWHSFGNVSKERIQRMSSDCFDNWFAKRGFHKEDVHFLEFNSGTKFTSFNWNGQLQENSCKDAAFGKAFVMHELLENGDLLTDLFPTLWNEEYDSE